MYPPFQRLKQQLPAQPDVQQFNPAAGAPQMQWAPNPDEAQGDGQGFSDAAGMLGQFLKKRQTQKAQGAPGALENSEGVY